MSDCGIVKDLLPLYADDVCSIESKKLVSEHLAECESCQKELESYRLDIKTSSLDEKTAVKKFKRKTERRIVKKFISIILLLAIGVFGVYNVYWYTVFKRPFDKYEKIANEFLMECSEKNITPINAVLGEDNLYGIDTSEYGDLGFIGSGTKYLDKSSNFRIWSGVASEKGVIYKDVLDLNKVQMSIIIRQNSKGAYRYLVVFDELTDEDDSDIYFYIDKNMNLILQDPTEAAEKFYVSYSYMGEEQAKKHVEEWTKSHNITREELYEEVYDDLRVMMIVLHEGFGIGNVKA